MSDEKIVLDPNDNSVQLPFSVKKQDAILGHLLLDPHFFLQARNKITPTWFEDGYTAKVYKVLLEYYGKYEEVPSIEELTQWGDFNTLSNEDAAKMRKKVALAKMATADFHLQALREELEGWLRARLFKETVYQSQRLYNARRFSELYPYLNERLRIINDARFTDDSDYAFEKVREEAKDLQLDHERALTTGHNNLDRLLLPDAPRGSLLPGDTTILLAPVNVGKTTTMITIIAANIKLGKHILFLTHEGRPNDIAIKLWCSLLDCSQVELFNMMKDPASQNRLEWAQKMLERFLVYVPYNKAGANVEDVEPMIRRRQQERVALNGRGFDMLVCDYPAKLSTQLAKGGLMAKRHIDEIVYNYFVQLALEYKFHALLAIQTNREGSKLNRGQKEERRLLTMEDVAESFGPMQIATNVISINRPPIAHEHGLVTFFLAKSRSSETGWAFVCKTKYHHSITHSYELGATWYRGENEMSDKIRHIFDQHKNKPLPQHIQ